MLRVSEHACKRKDTDGLPWRLARCEVVRLICPVCKAKGLFVYHGYYLRNAICRIDGIIIDSKVPIERLRCKSCGTTHAVLSYAFIPYQSYTLRFYLNILSDKASNAFSSIEKLCLAYLMGINTYYRMKGCFANHLSLFLGASATTDEMQDWPKHSVSLTTCELEEICVGFHEAYGVTLLERRRKRTSRCTNAP